MGWTTPTDRTTGYVPTATDWNIIEDDLTFLYGDTGWTSVSGFTNSWTSNAAPQVARYRLVGSMVTMQGSIGAGTLNTAAFTLPAGYRPTETVVFVTDSNAAFGRFSITAAGVVMPITGATTNVQMCCTFSTL